MLADILRPRLPLDAAGRGVDRRVDQHSNPCKFCGRFTGATSRECNHRGKFADHSALIFFG